MIKKMGSNKLIGTSILIVAMVIGGRTRMSEANGRHSRLGVGGTEEAYYVEATTNDETAHAHMHGEDDRDGSPRHCFGSCTASCINPYSPQPHKDSLCDTICKAKCQF